MDHTDHDVSFFIAQQPGGWCDCGDDEAWRLDLKCPLHPPQRSECTNITHPIPPPQLPPQFQSQLKFTTKATQQAAATGNILLVSDYPCRINVPPELCEIVHLHYRLRVFDSYSIRSIIRLTRSCEYSMPNSIGRKKIYLHYPTEWMITGREVVEMSIDVQQLMEIAQVLVKVDISVTIR